VALVASDISARALARAKNGMYQRRSLRALPAFAAARWFVPIENGMRVEQRLTEAVEWRQINLMDAAMITELGEFDIVLCRNVLIYFSDETVQTLVERLTQVLRPGGRLIVGASESLLRFESGLVCEERGGAFFYRKAAP
jgi:chemotaxis protein methyltransferase CheR